MDKNFVLGLISKGKIESAIDFVLKNSKEKKEIVAIAARQRKLQEQINSGVIGSNEANILQNKITQSLLQLINADKNSENTIISESEKPLRKRAYGNVAQVVLAFCTLITLIILIYNTYNNESKKTSNHTEKNEEIRDEKLNKTFQYIDTTFSGELSVDYLKNLENELQNSGDISNYDSGEIIEFQQIITNTLNESINLELNVNNVNQYPDNRARILTLSEILMLLCQKSNCSQNEFNSIFELIKTYK